MNNYLREIKAIGIFVAIAAIIFGFAYLLIYFKAEILFYKILIGYIAICITALTFSKSKSKGVQLIVNIVMFPTSIILIIGTIIMPLGFLIVHALYYFAFVALIPELLFQSLIFFEIHFFKHDSTLMYIKFTLTVFLAVLFNYQLRYLIYALSPARLKTSQKLKPYQLDKLTDYLLSENNIRFLIYGIYVVILIIINYKNFEGHTVSIGLQEDKAILQSFVTFIAFDRSLILLKQLEFKPSDFLKKIVQSIIRKFKDLDSKNKV